MKREVEELFLAAADLPAPERGRFLAEHCEDPAVRAEVESLLAHDGADDRWIRASLDAVGSAAAAAIGPAAPGQRLGGYKLVRTIGRGGMGSVYLAEAEDGPPVAVKVVETALGSPRLFDRFEQECRILAQFEHPYIARFLAAGASEAGLPYLAMEYVEGEPVDRYCDSRRLTIEERLALFLKICEGVEYAHERLVVHRDLKPANILVTAGGSPRLLDFGIAKVLGGAGDLTSETRLLTPEYASPEQVLGRPVTMATDVYALGGVLYRLLTGQAPHRVEGKTPAELQRAICEEPAAFPPGLRPELDGDLRNILSMALRKEPERRYRTVRELANEIRRYREHRPVEATPDRFLYRAGRFLRRHRLPVAAGLAAAVALSLTAGVAAYHARRAGRRFTEVRRLANVFLFDFEKAIHGVPGTVAARQLVIQTGIEYLERLSREARGDAELTRELAAGYRKIGELQDPAPLDTVEATGDVRGALRHHQRAVELLRSIGGHESKDKSLRTAYAEALIGLSKARRANRDIEGALAAVEEAFAVAGDLRSGGPDHRGFDELLADAYTARANVRRHRDRVAALADARQAAVILEEIVRGASGDRAAREALGTAFLTAAMFETEQGESGAAAVSARRAVEILEPLSSAGPLRGGLARRLILSHDLLGRALFRTANGDRQQQRAGLERMKTAVALAEGVHAADRANASALNLFSALYSSLGYSAWKAGDERTGERYLAAATDAARELVERDPGNQEARLTWGMNLTFLAEIERGRGGLAAATGYRREAGRIYADLLARSPEDMRVLFPQAHNWTMLARLLARTGGRDEAERLLAQAEAAVRRYGPLNPGRDSLGGLSRLIGEVRGEAGLSAQ